VVRINKDEVSKKEKFLQCPICDNKTKTKIRNDTMLEKFPLFCQKCKKETIINAKQFIVTVINEPGARRRADSL